MPTGGRFRHWKMEKVCSTVYGTVSYVYAYNVYPKLVFRVLKFLENVLIARV